MLHRGTTRSGSKAKRRSARGWEAIAERARDHVGERDRRFADRVRLPIELHRCQPAPFFSGLLRGNNCRQSDTARLRSGLRRESCGGFCRRARKSPARDRPRAKHRCGRAAGANLARSIDGFAPAPQTHGGHHRQEHERRGLHRLAPRAQVRATAGLCLYVLQASKPPDKRRRLGMESYPGSRRPHPSRSPPRRRSLRRCQP